MIAPLSCHGRRRRAFFFFALASGFVFLGPSILFLVIGRIERTQLCGLAEQALAAGVINGTALSADELAVGAPGAENEQEAAPILGIKGVDISVTRFGVSRDGLSGGSSSCTRGSPRSS